MMDIYSDEYYQTLQKGAFRSAREVVPVILELIQPRHVIDLGCGTGAWLSVLKEHGVEDIYGVDGEWVVESNSLCIQSSDFQAADLTKPLRIDRTFDLVMSLEVAEHLSADCAGTLVDTLTRLGPVILFSAAVPRQGGTHHVNEQWPVYWTEHFSERGYVAIDALRQEIWNNEQVEWWYIQNALFFVQKDRLHDYPVLRRRYEQKSRPPLPVVHPRGYLERVEGLEKQIADLENREKALENQLETLRARASALWELKPGHVPLRNVIRSLPGLIKHALVQTLKK